MAMPSIIFKAELHIADMDRHYYETHNVTLARHSSETDERMMVRLLAFVMHASQALAFAQGLSSPDEPDLWSKSLQGDITQWIMVGLPDEKAIKKAAGRSAQVIVYAYGSGIDAWRAKNNVDKIDALTIVSVDASTTAQLAESVERSMRIQVSIQDGVVWWTHEKGTIEIAQFVLKRGRKM